MITIVGGTGRLGRIVTARLVEAGERVRVVGRSAPTTPVPGAEFVAADVREPSTLPVAVDGSTVVVSAMHGMDPHAGESPAEVDRDGNRALIAAARSAGAAIVLLSVVGVGADHPIELFRMKAAAEAALREGLTQRAPDWTIVRASAFAELWLDLFRATSGRSGVPTVMGPGRNPVNFVSVEDVAVAVARAAVDPSLRGRIIEVGGEDLSPTALAGLVTGPGAQPRHIPTGAVWAIGTLLRPVRPALARAARQTLVMERVSLSYDATPGHDQFPWLPRTPLVETASSRVADLP